MKITAYKCPWTGKLFEHRKVYAKHLKTVRNEQRAVREKARLAAKFDEFVAPLHQLNTTDEIAQWLTANYMRIALHYGPRWPSRKRYVPSEADYVEFVIEPMHFSEKCSTMHASPFGQRNTGWSDEHVPEAGWRGRIHLYPKGVTYRRDYICSDWLRTIGINTGSGGGHDEHLEYDLILFSKDFPKLAVKAAAHQVLKQHGGQGIDSNGKPITGGVGTFW